MYKLRKLHNENFILFPSNDPFFALLLPLSPCQSTQTTILNITDMVDNGFESSIFGFIDGYIAAAVAYAYNINTIYNICLSKICH